MNKKADWFFNKSGKWQNEFLELRETILSCGLTEELKWGCPCYTNDKKNIVLIHGFKNYCALLFFKGALLNDSKHLFTQQTANVQLPRQFRFTTHHEILKHKKSILAFIKNAIEVEKSGSKLSSNKSSEIILPKEFAIEIKKYPALSSAFNKLTPGRLRGYLLYFSAAKQSKTIVERIKKYTPKIIEGKGLND